MSSGRDLVTISKVEMENHMVLPICDSPEIDYSTCYETIKNIV
jgi:hypothetical protein